MHRAAQPSSRQIVDKWGARQHQQQQEQEQQQQEQEHSERAAGDHWGAQSEQTTSEIDDCPSIWLAMAMARDNPGRMDSARPCRGSRWGIGQSEGSGGRDGGLVMCGQTWA